MQQQSNSPIDKGRVAVIAERYPSSQVDQNGQPIMKNRYATVGRATLWPAKQGSMAPNVEIEIDTMPLGTTGPVKTYIFWDSDNQNNQAAPQQQVQQQGGYQQPAPHGQQQSYDRSR